MDRLSLFSPEKGQRVMEPGSYRILESPGCSAWGTDCSKEIVPILTVDGSVIRWFLHDP